MHFLSSSFPPFCFSRSFTLFSSTLIYLQFIFIFFVLLHSFRFHFFTSLPNPFSSAHRFPHLTKRFFYLPFSLPCDVMAPLLPVPFPAPDSTHLHSFLVLIHSFEHIFLSFSIIFTLRQKLPLVPATLFSMNYNNPHSPCRAVSYFGEPPLRPYLDTHTSRNLSELKRLRSSRAIVTGICCSGIFT